MPHAVLVGFVNAVAINILLGQWDNLTGYSSKGGNRVLRAVDSLLHVGSSNWPTVAIGLATVGLIVLLERTRLGPLFLVVAVVVTSTFAWLLSLDGVAVIGDIADLPNRLPTPALPRLGLVAELLVPALSLAFVGLVQGAAISGSITNPDGRYPDSSGDFRGRGRQPGHQRLPRHVRRRLDVCHSDREGRSVGLAIVLSVARQSNKVVLRRWTFPPDAANACSPSCATPARPRGHRTGSGLRRRATPRGLPDGRRTRRRALDVGEAVRGRPSRHISGPGCDDAPAGVAQQ